MDRKTQVNNMQKLTNLKISEVPNFDAPLYETPESAKGSSFETPEQKSLKNIAIALRGIEAQLEQLNKNLRKK